jgi:hypothetical protein
LRVASGVAAFGVDPPIFLAVLVASRFIDANLLPGNVGVVMWIIAGLFTVGGLANLASRSPLERYWAAVSVAIAACCAVIAAG